MSCSLWAQGHKDRGDLGEKYQAQKVAYITTALDLTAEEAAAFWPIYNEHEKKRDELSDSMRDYRSAMLEREDEITEEEALQALDFIQKHMGDMHELEQEYQKRFLEVIPAKKVLLLMKAEKDFRRNLLRKLGEKRGRR